MATFRGSGSTTNGAAFPTEAELETAIAAAAASAAAAQSSEDDAEVSESAAGVSAAASAASAVDATNNGAAQVALCEAEVVKTVADVVLTNADVVTTNADVVLTNADVVITTQDAIDTAADAVLTAADVVTTAATLDEFDDIYLGSKAADPTLDNDGDALATGALYWNTVGDNMRVYTGSVWDVWDYIRFSGGTMTGDLVAHSVTFTEVTHAAIGATKTVDWTADGSKQRIELSASTTLTFTDPPGPTNLMLIVQCGAATTYTVIWPSDVDWTGGVKPVFDTGTYDINIVSLYFDGDRYYGSFGYNFF